MYILSRNSQHPMSVVILGPGRCPRPERPGRPGHPGRPGQIWAELSRFLARDNFFLSGTCPGQEFLLAHQPCVRSFQRKSIAFIQSGPAWWGRPGKRDVPAHRDVRGVRGNYPGAFGATIPDVPDNFAQEFQGLKPPSQDSAEKYHFVRRD